MNGKKEFSYTLHENGAKVLCSALDLAKRRLGLGYSDGRLKIVAANSGSELCQIDSTYLEGGCVYIKFAVIFGQKRFLACTGIKTIVMFEDMSGNRWRMRKVHLPENFRKFFSGTVLGFYGPEGIPAAIRLRGHRSSWIRPEDGSEQPLSAEDASRFSSAAYRFYEQFPDRKMTRKDLALFALDGLAQVGRRIVFLGICIGLLGFVLPIATEYLAGQIIPTANTLELRQLTVLLLSLTFATALLGLAPQVSLLAYGAHQTERFQAALFDHILNVKIDFFRQYNTGELCTRLLSAIRIQETVFAVLSGQFLGALFSLSSLVMLFVYSWRLPGIWTTICS